MSKLRDAGFEIESGIAGMPTAFVASFGEGSPVIGILQSTTRCPACLKSVAPQREPVQAGLPGHACGHSGLGTGTLGAAIATKEAMVAHGLEGTIRLYGTPAEETVIGKVYMTLAGVFDDLDIRLHWHPADKNGAWAGSSKALVSAKFTFTALRRHASVSPSSGRSALDAVELMNVGANFMRGAYRRRCSYPLCHYRRWWSAECRATHRNGLVLLPGRHSRRRRNQFPLAAGYRRRGGQNDEN